MTPIAQAGGVVALGTAAASARRRNLRSARYALVAVPSGPRRAPRDRTLSARGERRGEVVPRGWKVFARRRQRVTPPGEQRLDLLLGRRNPRGGRGRAGRPVELVDRLRDHVPGQRVDVTLVSRDQELEEPSQRSRLAPPSRPCLPAFLPQVGQEPVRIGRCRCPQRTSQKPGELEHDRAAARVQGDRARQIICPSIGPYVLFTNWVLVLQGRRWGLLGASAAAVSLSLVLSPW
jgi:hypothetical protein